MRILVHDYGGYPFCLELSREIAARGHQVQHVFFPAACTSIHNMDARASDPATLKIVPLGTELQYAKYASLFRRRAQEIAYGRRLGAHIAEWKPDIVLSANAPLDVQRRAIAASHAIKARFTFWLQDIISVAMSVILKERLGAAGALVARYYRMVEADIARRSDSVIAIAEDFLPVLKCWNVASERCHVIENWAPKDDIHPGSKDNSWSRANGLHDKHVLLYSGRLGFKHNPKLLLALAEEFRTDPNVIVLVIAEGQGADWLAEQKTLRDLPGLQQMPFQPYAELSNALASGDVLICIIEQSAHLYSVPSKILSYLAAGRAILAAMPEDNVNAQHIARVQAGLVVPPERPDAAIDAARRLLANESIRARYAGNARRYAEEAFDIQSITDRFLKILLRT
ncbi:MAG: glycosyltransferase family 4 protein [Rhizomicrobium sp.]